MTSFDECYAVMFCNDMSPVERQAFPGKLGRDNRPLSFYTYRDWRYDRLGPIRSTYVLCEKDMSPPPHWQQRFAEQLRVDKAVRIDAGHQAMNTKPQELAAALLTEIDG